MFTVAAAQAGTPIICYLVQHKNIYALVGTHSTGRTSYGHSLAVNAWGTVVGSLDGEHAGVLVVGYNRKYQTQIRAGMNMQDDMIYE